MEFLSGIWSGIIAAVSSALSTVLGTVTGKFSAILRFITSTATKILNMLTSTFTNLWRSITNTVGNIKTSIINGFQTAINWIRSLPGQAIQWGADIINGIVDGIRGAIGRVGDAAKDVAGKITSFLHFSRPDEGPLAEYESWMPDFVGGLAQGIRAGIPVIRSAVKELSGNMRIDAAPVFNGNQTENAVPPAETAAPNAIPKKERLQISAAVPAKEPQMQRMDAGRKV